MAQYLHLLRDNRNYRLLWLGATASYLGDWFNLIASATLIARLTDSGTAISTLFLARFLPIFLFSPIAGVLADRYNRRAIMVLSDLLRALVVLGFLLIRQPSQIWLLYLLTVSQFTLSALFTPARTAVFASVVAPRDLVTANALDSLTWSTMLAVGAMLGGLVAALFGGTTAFIVDALTFLLSAWLISRIALPARLAAVTHGGWLAFRQGLAYLRGAPLILALSLVKGGGSLIWGAVNVLEITYAESIFPLGGSSAGTLGIIYTISGLGTGVGPLFMRRWLGDAPARARWAIVLGFGLLSAGLFILGTAPTLLLFGLGTLVRTLGSGTLWVFSASLLQRIVPDTVRGRVFAFEFAVLTLTQSLSIYWAGLAQDSLGLDVRQTTILTAWAGLGVFVAWGLFFLRTRGRALLAPPPA